MQDVMNVNQKEYKIVKLLGHGKGGYSYLAEREGKFYVLKQIHHEPCEYYSFGNKIEAEQNDYNRLLQTGIRIPRMLDIDVANERILKEYIDYECNNYMDEWNFENWGIKYWSKTTEFIDYMEQHEKGELNPAKLLNHFTSEEEHREAASLFHTKIRQLKTKEEQDQALKDTILKVKAHSINERTLNLDPSDMAGLQHLMEEKRKLEELRQLHISID